MANSAFTKKFCVRVSYTVSAFPDDYVEMLLSRRHKDTYNCETPQKNWVIRWNHVVRGYTRISKPSIVRWLSAKFWRDLYRADKSTKLCMVVA